MYLPSAELQTYRGQLTCQYCIMDLKDQERRMEERAGSASKGAERDMSEGREEERCERCGRGLSIVYFYNGKRLCSTCIDEERKEWGTKGGERPPMVAVRIQQEKGILSSIVSAVENRIGEAIHDHLSKKPGSRSPKTEKERKERRDKTEKNEAQKEDSKEKVSSEQAADPPPMTEGLVKKHGTKYEIAEYKKIGTEELIPTSSRKSKRKEKPGKKF